ncbi:MAG: hypothetical protein Q8K75_02095 [Chlamydiales bacterium]|nr:hypothetical protein [Chlamydiales bacterium]
MDGMNGLGSASGSGSLDPAEPSPVRNSPKDNPVHNIAKVRIVNTEYHDYDQRGVVSRWTSKLTAPISWATGVFNKQTILRGALGKWDESRALEKKMALQDLGGVNLTLVSPTGCEVDAVHLDSKAFFDTIENSGGEFKHVKVEFHDDSPLKSLRTVELDISDSEGKPVGQVLAFELPETTPIRDAKMVSNKIDPLATLVRNPETGKLYVIKEDQIQVVNRSKSEMKYKENEIPTLGFGTIQVKPNDRPTPFDQPFTLIAFDKNSPDTEFFKENISKIAGGGKSSHMFVDVGDKSYFLPITENGRFQSMLNPEQLGAHADLTMSSLLLNRDRSPGTIVITQDQTSKFEQAGAEFIAFLMEGINVMAYNTAGKGLSEGPATQANINASLEAAYQYVAQDCKVPDDKIIAKGTCFGGGPSAWLAKQHPEIGVMLDQNPSNFWDVAIRAANEVVAASQELVDDLAEKTGVGEQSYLASGVKAIVGMFKDNYAVQAVAQTVFAGYDVAEDLKYNHGHKLINIDVPNTAGRGGDDLVPESHPYEMAASIVMNATDPDKVNKLSIAPGAKHITGWWLTEESRLTVHDFLDRTGLAPPPFKEESQE